MSTIKKDSLWIFKPHRTVLINNKTTKQHHGASKKKIYDIELSGRWVKNAKKEKKIFFVFLMINLNKLYFLVGHNYWKKNKKSDYQKCNHACIMHVLTATIYTHIKQYVWIGRLSANIANISIGLTTCRPIIQKLTEESISSNW